MTNLEWGDRRFIDHDGLLLHVETAGSGTPVALLHGFASGTFTWAGIAPLLADSHHLVAWDRPPFGRSERPRDATEATYGVDAELAYAATVLGEAKADSPVLIGHSAGCLLAVQATVANAIAPRGLVLIAPALSGSPPAAVRALSRLPGVSHLGRAALRAALPRADKALARMGRNPTPLIKATGAETAKTLALPGTAEGLWHLTSNWAPPDPFPKLTVPTLVISGDDDRISTPEVTETAVDSLGAQWHRLPGVGHAAHEQVPEVVAGLVADFIAGLDAS